MPTGSPATSEPTTSLPTTSEPTTSEPTPGPSASPATSEPTTSVSTTVVTSTQMVNETTDLTTPTVVVTQSQSTPCVDLIPNWVDSDSDSCDAYERSLWCTPDGGYGPDWDSDDNTFQTFAVDGLSAAGVCCACGGGNRDTGTNGNSAVASFDLLAGSTNAPPTIRLAFTDMIISGSFDTNSIVLHSAMGSSSESLRLSGGDISPASVTATDTLYVTLSTADFARLLSFQQLARSDGTTWISIDASSLTSISGNALAAIVGVPVRHRTVHFDAVVVPTQAGASTAAFNIGTTVRGGLPPVLVGAGLDMSTGIVLLTFQTEIDAATLEIGHLYVQSSTFGDAFSYRFKSGSITTALEDWGAAVPAHSVLVKLSVHDHNALLANTELASHLMTTYFYAEYGLIRDTAGMSSFAIPSSRAVQVGTYVADVARPILRGFDLDMRAGTLNLNFTEPMALDSVVYSRITLQTSASGAMASFSISVGAATLPKPEVIQIDMAVADILILQQNGIASSSDTTFLSLDYAAATDVAGNANDAISPNSAIQVSRFTTATGIAIDVDFADGSGKTAETSNGLSDVNKALISVAASFVLLILLLLVFVSPKCTAKSSYSPFFWEAGDNVVVSGMINPAPTNAELEWDAHVQTSDHLKEGDIVETVRSYIQDQDDELSLHQNEILTVVRLAENMPGWIYAKNMKLDVGLVPVAMIKRLDTVEIEDEEVDLYVDVNGTMNANVNNNSNFDNVAAIAAGVDLDRIEERDENQFIQHLGPVRSDIDIDADQAFQFNLQRQLSGTSTV